MLLLTNLVTSGTVTKVVVTPMSRCSSDSVGTRTVVVTMTSIRLGRRTGSVR